VIGRCAKLEEPRIPCTMFIPNIQIIVSFKHIGEVSCMVGVSTVPRGLSKILFSYKCCSASAVYQVLLRYPQLQLPSVMNSVKMTDPFLIAQKRFKDDESVRRCSSWIANMEFDLAPLKSVPLTEPLPGHSNVIGLASLQMPPAFRLLAGQTTKRLQFVGRSDSVSSVSSVGLDIYNLHHF
jgi:hypothetical protein